MMAYSKELNMLTVHHYSPIPFLHVYKCTCMCIYPDCDKMKLSWFSVYGEFSAAYWPLSTQRCKIYFTTTIVVSVLVFVDEALLLCPAGQDKRLLSLLVVLQHFV